MRKKLTIFTVAIGFFTLCNVVLYTRKLRADEMSRFWRWSLVEQQSLQTSNCSYSTTTTVGGAAILDDSILCNNSGSRQVASVNLTLTGTIHAPGTVSSRRSPGTTLTSSPQRGATSVSKSDAVSTVPSGKRTTVPTSHTVTFNQTLTSANQLWTSVNSTFYVLHGRTFLLATLNGSEVIAQVSVSPLNRTVTVTLDVSVFEVHNVTDDDADGSVDDVIPEVLVAGGVNVTMPTSGPIVAPLTLHDVQNASAASSSSSQESTLGLLHSHPFPRPLVFSQGLTPLNRHPFNYLINLPDLCSAGVSGNNTSTRPPLTLLILVATAVNHLGNRQAIRETWGGYAKSRPDVRLAFVMGRPVDASEEASVVSEALQHGDVVQEDFWDTYKNLTLKTVMLLKWAHTRCAAARYVMKTDDDMFINIPNLLKYLRSLKSDRRQLFGRLVKSARPLRSRNSKYYVPLAEYRDNVYPDYLSGTAYVMSADVAHRLYETSLVTPIFFFEDVYITGICAKKAGLVRRNHPGFVYYKRPVKGCAYFRVISGHNNSPSDLRKIWKDFSKKNFKCL